MLYEEWDFNKALDIRYEVGRKEERKENREYFISLLDQDLSKEEIVQRLEQKFPYVKLES